MMDTNLSLDHLPIQDDPYQLFMREKFANGLISVFVASSALPLNIAIFIQIIRTPRRRATAINLLIGFHRLVVMVLVSLLVLPFLGLDTLCTSVYIVLPTLMLLTKLVLSMSAGVRYLYIGWDTWMRSCSGLFIWAWTVSLSVLLASLPLMTLWEESHPGWQNCRQESGPLISTQLSFVVVYWVIFANSLLLDAFCYISILNYMRKALVRIMIVPVTTSERNKAHNIIVAPSSLLIWLISVVFMLPSGLMMMKSPSMLQPQDHLVTFDYQNLFIFGFGTVVGLIYVGSSADLKHDFLLLTQSGVRFVNSCPITNTPNVEVTTDPEPSLGNAVPSGRGASRMAIYALTRPSGGDRAQAEVDTTTEIN